MTPEHRQILQQKRELLQQRIRFNKFIDDFVTPVLPILDELQRQEINHQVVSLRCIPKEFTSMLAEQFTTETFVKYTLSEFEIQTEDSIIEALMEVYPNTHPIRYVPNLPIIDLSNDPAAALTEIIRTNHLADRHIYLCWLRYAFLLKADIQDLAQKANEELFNSWHGDTLIFPTDLSWCIAYSINDEWRLGKHTVHSSNFLK